MKVKVRKAESDCWNTADIICPYCGGAQSNSSEYGNGEEIGAVWCGYCGREFIAEREITISYSSRPLGTKPYDSWDEGDVFDDGITEEDDEKWANIHGENPCEVVKEEANEKA